MDLRSLLGFLLALSGALCGTLWLPAALPIHGQTPSRTPAPTYTPSSLYLPVISGIAVAQPTRTVQSVYGLTGLVQPGRSTAAKEFQLPNGRNLALVAATPAIDAELAALAARQPAPNVKIWGTLYAAGSDDSAAFIVVSDVIEIQTGPAPAATPAPASVVAVGRFDSVNLRSAPQSDAARSGQILIDQRCALIGRTPDSNWVLIDCPSGARGWIEPRFVTIEGTLFDAPIVTVSVVTPPTPTPSPTPIPTPKPFVFSGWRALYFDNAQLRGVPVAVADVPELNFDWGTGPLRPGMPADYTSASFERVVDFDPGFYFFTAEADDGIRVIVDGVTLLDQWNNASGQTFRFGRLLSGEHDLRVEYNEITGAARLRFFWQVGQGARWQASYAGLPNLSSGAMAQTEPDGGQFRLDYNWGWGSPTGAPADNWSARWSGRYSFQDGNYIFIGSAEDGIRVSIDGTTVLNKWTDGFGEVRNRFLGVGAGDHLITVEYFDRQGPARIRVWWYLETPGAGVPQ